jgi:type IV secretion system protein VirD4
MIYKARKPDAPAQTWILDECAQLKGFSLVPRMKAMPADALPRRQK